MTQHYRIRPVTVDDADTITRHRNLMFAMMGGYTQDGMERMDQAWRTWLPPRLESGEYLGWFAVTGGPNGREEVAAGVGIWMMPWPPSPAHDATVRPYVLNVYTEEAHRRRGLARHLMQHLLRWCFARGYQYVSLHASVYGRPLYADLGFRQTNEMRVSVEDAWEHLPRLE